MSLCEGPSSKGQQENCQQVSHHRQERVTTCVAERSEEGVLQHEGEVQEMVEEGPEMQKNEKTVRVVNFRAR